MTGGSRDARRRCRLRVRGLVQGVGFRPFVYATAAELGLTGSVANSADGVSIDVEGTASALEMFAGRLRSQAPPLAMVVSVDSEELDVRGGTGFVIESSRPGDRARTLASPDVTTCRDCLNELVDPANRRYRHPFITCTNCGPRFTIITALPYDRAQTTMAGFAMCAACRAEYFYTADTASLEMFGFIKRQLNADDVLLARKPRLMALMSDRRSTIWPEHPTLQSFWVYSDKVNATYLLELTKCVPSDLDELSGIIDESEQRLRLIFENNEFRIYKIRHL